jgi:hypothetical protein
MRLDLCLVPTALGGLLLGGCGGNGDDPGRTEATTSDGSATAQPTSFTGTTASSAGTEEPEPTGSSTGSSPTSGPISGTGSATCPDTHTCVPEAPVDWQGPVTRATSLLAGAVEPDCPPSYPEVATESFSNILAEPAECSCSCGPAVDAQCESSATLRYHDESATCSDPAPQSITLFSGCNNLSLSYPGQRNWQLEPVETTGGSCAPSADVIKDDATFENRVLACTGATLLDGCASGNVCTPRPPEDFDAGLCIWQEGEHECPSPYPERTVVFRDILDQRTCEGCQCGEARGLCEGTVSFLYNTGCLLPLAGTLVANGECNTTTNTNINFASLSLGDPVAFCTPSGASPAGTARGNEPTTICCSE